VKIGIQKVIVNGCLQNAVLDALAEAATSLGHTVGRYHHEPEGDFDVAVIWNGLYNWAVEYRNSHLQQRMLFAELGWSPQAPCFQLDHLGVNGFASWANDTISPNYMISLPPADGDDELLVILQDDADTQIYNKWLSPMFRNMAEWLAWLAAVLPRFRLRVREHPKHSASVAARSVVDQAPNMFWDDSKDIDKAIDRTVGALSINSSCGVKVLKKMKPIMAFGRSVFSSVCGASYLVFPAEDPRIYTQSAAVEIIERRSNLSLTSQVAALGRIEGKQWWPDENLAEKLAWVLR